MSQRFFRHLPAWIRLTGLTLLFAFGLLTSGSLTTARVHAQQATTMTITDCSDDSQLQSAIASAASGDTIAFGCSGDIQISSFLNIDKSLTLNGSGQHVTLDGSSNANATGEGVLTVDNPPNPGHITFFTLNALTVANRIGSTVGGLENDGATVTITNSTFVNNTGPDAGAIDNIGGTMTISNSTFVNNSAQLRAFTVNSGGAIHNQQGGNLTITNSTFVKNSASTGYGGGLFNSIGTVTISNSTFASNSAPRGGGLFNDVKSTITISGSIVANNSGGDCAGGPTDGGYNLSSDSSCGFIASIDQQNTDPKLDPNGLQNNGGPTQTIALQVGSPAIDHIPTASCPATDGRGMSRPDDNESACDIGAYESGAHIDSDLGLTHVPANLTVDATYPQGAIVRYALPTATDEPGDKPGPSVSCTPASGSAFPIGPTKVTCTASDSDDTPSTVGATFTVTVNGAAAQLGNLIRTVNNFHFQQSIQYSLDVLLGNALYYVHNQPKLACATLDQFRLKVTQLTGQGITSSQASQLIASARRIQAVIGC